jgi:hypothetical protein
VDGKAEKQVIKNAVHSLAGRRHFGKDEKVLVNKAL